MYCVLLAIDVAKVEAKSILNYLVKLDEIFCILRRILDFGVLGFGVCDADESKKHCNKKKTQDKQNKSTFLSEDIYIPSLNDE